MQTPSLRYVMTKVSGGPGRVFGNDDVNLSSVILPGHASWGRLGSGERRASCWWVPVWPGWRGSGTSAAEAAPLIVVRLGCRH